MLLRSKEERASSNCIETDETQLIFVCFPSERFCSKNVFLTETDPKSVSFTDLLPNFIFPLQKLPYPIE